MRMETVQQVLSYCSRRMQSYLSSLRFALQGLFHAFRTERNLKLFGSLYLLTLMVAVALRIEIWDWSTVIFTGGVFLAVELLNTALEHFTDAFDLHSKSIHAPAVKATKDIAAGASLVCAVAWGLILCIVFVPYVMNWWVSNIGAEM